MVDTTKESTCWPVNSNDEIVIVDGDGSNTVVAHLPNEFVPVSPTNKRVKMVLPDNISRQWHGWVDYNDTATQSTPLVVVPNVAKKLTNDGLGQYTNRVYQSKYITDIWNTSTNQLSFSEFQIGDTVDFRIEFDITTNANNQEARVEFHLGVSDPNAYTIVASSPLIYKASGTYKVHAITSFYIGNELTLNNPGEIYILSDDNATVKVGGFFIKYTLQPRAAT